jgi:hypothetical protein
MEIGMERPARAASQRFAHANALVAVLSARGIVNGTFAIWLLTQHPRWADVFAVGSTYGFVDGALGLVTVVLLLPRTPDGAPPLLRVTTLLDALVRLGVSVAIRALPGIPDTPITIMLFFATLAAYALGLGVVAIVVWLIGHARWRKGSSTWRPGTGELFDPLAVAGVLVLGVVAYSLHFGPAASVERLRSDAMWISGGFAFAFLVAAAGAVRTNRTRWAAVS